MEFANNLDMILNIPNISYWNGYTPLLSQSIQYEPTLMITNPDSDTFKQNDPTNAIFGFNNIQTLFSA